MILSAGAGSRQGLRGALVGRSKGSGVFVFDWDDQRGRASLVLIEKRYDVIFLEPLTKPPAVHIHARGKLVGFVRAS